LKLGEEIEILGSVREGEPIDGRDLLEALSRPPVPLVHGGEFTGRPGKRVHAGDAVVVKLYTAISPKEREARGWVARALARERECAVHHPRKTWFLRRGASGITVGNATPRLLGLHRARGQVSEAGFLAALEAMFALYVGVAARCDLRLDEGLSNFGLEPGGGIHYLDDDFFPWDRFAACAEMVATTIRRLPDLGEASFAAWGVKARGAILGAFGDPHLAVVLAEQVRSANLLGEAQERCREAFLRGLAPIPARGSPGARVADRRFALLADIHANLPALDAVLAELDRLGVRHAVVLGDLVGYGPHPAQCIARVRSRGYPAIMGNHDHAAATLQFGGGFSKPAASVIRWTREVLDEADIAWLGSLPAYLRHDDWLAVHGAPVDPTFFNAYVYRQTFEDNLANLAERGIRWCFHGHTHIAGVYRMRRGVSEWCADAHVDLSGSDNALVCPGSVGQPRGGGTGAQFAVFDAVSRQLELREVDYPVGIVARDMRERGLPEELVRKLPGIA
jgi:diadenosine tetraphosphatase ApaH/serine/threonine PP2A family protein phosphatase